MKYKDHKMNILSKGLAVLETQSDTIHEEMVIFQIDKWMIKLSLKLNFGAENCACFVKQFYF